MQKGMVSVIIPVYNSEKYIEETIRSVIGQTYKNLEIIIVDDCSLDTSAKIIKEISSEYPFIIYWKLDQNSGAAVARNKGMELAKGQYIAFLDSDDWWYAKKLEKQVELLERNQAIFAFCAIEMIDDNGNIIKKKRKVADKVDYKYLLKNTIIATSTVVVDIEKAGKFQMPYIRTGQDYATWLMLLKRGIIAYGLDETLTKYRLRENSLSSNKTANIKKVWKIQVQNENIPPILAFFHCICYAWNAVKKYYL